MSATSTDLLARSRRLGVAVAATVVDRDRAHRWDEGLFRELGREGLLTAELEPEARCALLEAFAASSGDAGVGLAWGAHLAGCLRPLVTFGSEAQRRYLPGLADGSCVGAWAHHEPPSGASVPWGVTARATPRGDGWVLDGVKARVVNGGVADLYVVTAVTDASRGARGVSAFLVERGAPGLRVTPRAPTAGLRTARFADLTLDACELRGDARLGPEGEGVTRVGSIARRWMRACLDASWVGHLGALVARSVELVRAGRAADPAARAPLADLRIAYELSRRTHARAARSLADEARSDGADREGVAASLFIARAVERVTSEAARMTGPDADPMVERLQRDAAARVHVTEPDELLRALVASSLLDLG